MQTTSGIDGLLPCPQQAHSVLCFIGFKLIWGRINSSCCFGFARMRSVFFEARILFSSESVALSYTGNFTQFVYSS